MNAYAAAALTTAAAVVFWNVAAAAAGRRAMTIGTLPLPLPALVGGAAIVAGPCGVPAGALIALSGAAVAGWVDARTGSIFDPLTIALLVLATVLAVINGSAIAGACGLATIGIALLLLYTLTRGRGIGLGDVKLGAALGMALGVTSGLTAIGFAFVLGAIYGVWLLATKRADAGTPVRFAPFIAAGTFAAVLIPRTLLP